jgi:hypothetical protein
LLEFAPLSPLLSLFVAIALQVSRLSAYYSITCKMCFLLLVTISKGFQWYTFGSLPRKNRQNWLKQYLSRTLLVRFLIFPVKSITYSNTMCKPLLALSVKFHTNFVTVL